MESWETKTPFRELIEQDDTITNVLSKEVGRVFQLPNTILIKLIQFSSVLD